MAAPGGYYPPGAGAMPYATAPAAGAMPAQMTMAPAPAAVMPTGGVVLVPGGAVPAGMVVGAAPLYDSTLDVLVKNPGLFVKEKVKMLEVLTDWQTENTFTISTWDPVRGSAEPANPKAGKGAEVLTAKEVSSCCQRQFCGRLRAFDIAIVPSTPITRTYHPGMENRDTMFAHPDALLMSRPFKCTACCFNRPVIYLKHNSLGRFATVQNPCTICAYQFDIFAASEADGGNLYGAVSPTIAGEAGALWYRVHGTACQPAAFCFCPFGECARLRLQVYDGADAGMTRPIGEVARVFPGCCKAIATEADDFTIAFPQGMSEHGLKRASLVSGVMLLNYLFFERKRRRDHHHGRDGMMGAAMGFD